MILFQESMAVSMWLFIRILILEGLIRMDGMNEWMSKYWGL